MIMTLKTYLRNFLFLIISAAALCSCGDGKSGIDSPVRISAYKVQPSAEAAALNYSGIIEAGHTVNLSFLTIGTVRQVYVREGDKVKKGQLLAELDTATAEKTFQIAKDKHDQAEDGYNRAKPMYDHGNLAEIKMVEIQTARSQARLAAEIAQKHVNDCYMYAPDDGYISRRMIEPGGNAAAGMPAFTFISIDKAQAAVSVPEKEIIRIKKGMRAIVKMKDGKEYKARTADISLSANPLSRTYTVRAMIDSRNPGLLPGMLCEVSIYAGNSAPKITVPASALSIDTAGNEFVYAIDEQTMLAHKKTVRTSGFAKDGVIIESGLAGNELIAAEGAYKLDEGIKVELAVSNEK